MLFRSTEDDDDGNATSTSGKPTETRNVESSESAERGGNASRNSIPDCSKCGGAMWDNTEWNAKRVAEGKNAGPLYKCKDKNCDGVIWPEKPKEPKTDGKDPEWEAAKNELAKAAARAWPSQDSRGRATQALAFYADTRGVEKTIGAMSVAELKALAQDINRSMEATGETL